MNRTAAEGADAGDKTTDATTAERADTGAAAAATTEDTFALDITLSGLCMLVRRKTQNELVVLLPPVQAHPGHGGMPEHLAVLGTHKRYAGSGPFERKGQFREYVLGDGELVLDLRGGDKLELDLHPFKVADLTGVSEGREPDESEARVSLAITKGRVCAECAHDKGVRWRFDGRKRQMATRLAWRITGLTNKTPNGRIGIGITFRPKTGPDVPLVIRALPDDPDDPGSMRAAFYLYHTPPDELPSHAGHPHQQAEAEGDENRHFGAYYVLFEPDLQVPLPVRVDEDEDEEEANEDADEKEADEDEDEGKAEADEERAGARRLIDEGRKKQADDRKAAAGSAMGGSHGYHGRLFTCTLSTWTDDSE